MKQGIRSDTFYHFCETCQNCLRKVYLVLESVLMIHSKDVIHGDLKPANILRVDDVYTAIDFDGSCRKGLTLSTKFSSAYAPGQPFPKN